MATTYNYETGKIERDFNFARYNEACRLTELPCRIGSARCLECRYRVGTIYSWELHGSDSFAMCKHPYMPDSPVSGAAEALFNEYFRNQALSIV